MIALATAFQMPNPSPLPSLTPTQMRYLSPLRYPGGKAKLSDFVRRLIEGNNLQGGEYVEPYAGGASVALALLMQDVVRNIHVNDLDPAIFSFWNSAINEPDSLCSMISQRRVSVAEWKRQLHIQRNPSGHDSLQIGFSTLFLNRTNHSGIICSGGMIGGAKQDGNWRLGARFNKSAIIARIERIAKIGDRIRLYQQDALAFISGLLPTLNDTSLVYLDPPYYVKGRRRLYSNFYNHDDHAHIASALGRLDAPWLVSYDDQREIRQLYRNYRCRQHKLAYTARDRSTGKEVLIFSPHLRIPRQISRTSRHDNNKNV